MGRPAAPFVLPEWLGRSRLVLPVDFDAALDPSVKNYTVQTNCTYNGRRFEDIWLDH